MRVYLGKDRKCVTGTMTATHATVTGLTSRIENVEYKLYMDNFFPLWIILNYLTIYIQRPWIATVLSEQVKKECHRILEKQTEIEMQWH